MPVLAPLRFARLSTVELVSLLEIQARVADCPGGDVAVAVGGTDLASAIGIQRETAARTLSRLAAGRVLLVEQRPGRSTPGYYRINPLVEKWRCGLRAPPDRLCWSPEHGPLDEHGGPVFPGLRGYLPVESGGAR